MENVEEIGTESVEVVKHEVHMEIPSSESVSVIEKVKYDLHEEIKKQIEVETPGIREAVVIALAHIEIAKRKTALEKALSFLDAAKTEVKKFKPVETFDAEGKVISSSFSKEEFTKLKEARGKVAKIELAIEEALNDHNYSKVLNLK